MKFQVNELLEKNGKTAYALWKASGLSKTTIYGITGGKMDGVKFDTLEKLILGLKEVLGRPVKLEEVIGEAESAPRKN